VSDNHSISFVLRRLPVFLFKRREAIPYIFVRLFLSYSYWSHSSAQYLSYALSVYTVVVFWPPAFETQRCIYIYIFLWRCGPTRAIASSFLRFLDHTQRRITVGSTSLDEWSARRRDLYLTTLNTDRHPCPGGIRTQNPSMRAAVDPRLKPRGHWDLFRTCVY
jgi:hypothetical protein